MSVRMNGQSTEDSIVVEGILVSVVAVVDICMRICGGRFWAINATEFYIALIYKVYSRVSKFINYLKSKSILKVFAIKILSPKVMESVHDFQILVKIVHLGLFI